MSEKEPQPHQVFDPYLELRWSGSCAGSYEGEPSAFRHDVPGEVVEVCEDDSRRPAGRFQLYYVDADGATNAGMPLFDVMDMMQSTFEYYEALFNSSVRYYKPKVFAALDEEPLEANLLILDRLELLPRYRGCGLGLQLLCELMRRFSPGAGVIAMKPFPLQFEGHAAREAWTEWDLKMGIDRMTRDERAATRRLREHYAQLGFRPVKGTPYMVRDALRPLPDIGRCAKAGHAVDTER